MKHTPGPWKVIDENKSVFIVSSKMHGGICTIPRDNMHQSEHGSNAKLIAAAPELLEACQEFVRKVEAGEAKSTRSYLQMKEVIKKATE